MKIIVFIYFTINGLSAQPYIMDAPHYVVDKESCTKYIKSIAEDYEKTQPGWKFDWGMCKVKN
jgi:hypothetical protein